MNMRTSAEKMGQLFLDYNFLIWNAESEFDEDGMGNFLSLLGKIS